MVAVRNNQLNFHAKYQRLEVRRGKKKTIVAVAHSLLIAIYHVLSGVKIRDLGSMYYDQFNSERKVKSYLDKHKKFGWHPAVPATVN